MTKENNKTHKTKDWAKPTKNLCTPEERVVTSSQVAPVALFLLQTQW